MTPTEKLAKITMLKNQLRWEAQKLGIRSPYKQSLYINQKLKERKENATLVKPHKI